MVLNQTLRGLIMPEKTTFSKPDTPVKKSVQEIREEFLAKAQAARAKYFARKKSGKKSDEPLTPMQRRMHSGGV
jgi:hypothetical protein